MFWASGYCFLGLVDVCTCVDVGLVFYDHLMHCAFLWFGFVGLCCYDSVVVLVLMYWV